MSQLIILVPAAGSGSRFRGGMPKQYSPLAGSTVLAQSLSRLAQALAPALLAVALAPDDLHYARMAGRPADALPLYCGGPTRAATVANALAALAERVDDDDWILVHDAARPCVPAAALRALVEHLRDDAVGGLLAIPVADTIKRSDGDVDAPRVVVTADRRGLWQAQTPQMFRCSILRRALAATDAETCTDEAQAVEALGLKPRLIRGSAANIKITYPEDLALAAAILSALELT